MTGSQALTGAEPGPRLAGASGFQPLEVGGPMARWKQPQSVEFISESPDLAVRGRPGLGRVS